MPSLWEAWAYGPALDGGTVTELENPAKKVVASAKHRSGSVARHRPGQAARPGLWLRALLGLGLLAALTLTAAACGGSDFEAGPLGAVKVAPGEAIQIRSMQALSGAEDLGLPNHRGVTMAVADYGSVRGHDVALGAGLDSACSEAGGRAAAEAGIADPLVVGVIGPSCSVAAAAVSPVLSQAGLVMIAPSTTSPSLTSDLQGRAGSNNHPGYYRVANNDLYQARAVAHFAYVELGLRETAAIHDGDPYTSGLSAAFSDAFEALGGAVTIFAVSKGDTDMAPVLSRIAAGSPDSIFFPLFANEGIALLQEIGRIAELEDVTLIGGAALLAPTVLAVPESEGVYFPGPATDFEANINEATGVTAAELVSGYVEAYGEPPSSAYLPHAYDAATMLLRAIDEVAVSDGDTLHVDRAKVREALTALDGFGGIIGTISCDDFGDCGVGSVQISHHTDSAVTDVAELPVVHYFRP